MFNTNWLSGVVAEFVSNRTKKRYSIAQESKSRRPEFGRLEALENRTLFTAFTAGNVAVLDVLTANADNDTASVLALSPSAANQPSPATTVGINGTSGSSSLRFDPGSGKTAFLSDTNDGTLLAFSGYKTTSTSSSLALNTITSRGVGSLDSNTNFNLATSYTGTNGNDARDATSSDNSTWYIDNKDGLYTNNGTAPFVSTNVLQAKSFGGTIYVSSANSPNVAVSTVSSTTTSSLTALPGLPTDANLHDFYLISSGTNGTTFDVLYTLDETSPTAGSINKYALVNGTWTSEGSYTTNFGGDGLAVAGNGSGSGYTGASIYVTSGKGGTAKNQLIRLTDNSAWNATINITTASNVTLYTAASGNTLMGVAFVPTPAIGTTTAVTTASGTTGNPVTLTATVSANSGSIAPNTGSVQFYSGSTLLGTATSATTSGTVATYTFSGTLPTATYSNIQADYISGGGGFTNSNSVAANGPTVTVSAPPKADLTVDISGPTQGYTNNVTYTLAASNIGTADADGDVTVQFTLPSANQTVTGTNGSGFTETQSGEVVTFSGGTLAAGATENLTVSVSDSTAEVVTAAPGTAVIDPNDTVMESSYSNNSSTTTVTTNVFPTFEITGIDVSPVVGTAFTGVVADFQDAKDSNPADFTATITWGDGQTSAGTLKALPEADIVNQAGGTDTFNLITVTGTNTYASAGTYPASVTVTNAVNGDTATVNLNAMVAYAPMQLTAQSVSATANTALTNQPVATFTDPGLIASLVAQNPNVDLTSYDWSSQFSASVSWGDGSAATAGSVSYNPSSKTFSVTGSHTYTQTGSFTPTVTVTPLTVSVVQVDSSDPNNLKLPIDDAQGGDENGNGLTDAAGPIFVDQFTQGATGQTEPLDTFSLPTVATTSGNYALTGASYSGSEDELSLSSNGQYLVIAGYDATANLWAAQPVYNDGTSIPRVIGTIDGQGDINTTTGLTNAFVGDNFRMAVSVDGQEFWSVGHTTLSGAQADGNIEYSTLDPASGASTMITSGNPSNTNTDEIFNGQLYMGTRKEKGLPAGVIQVGTGLPTGTNTPETSFIAVPQTNPFNIYNYVAGEGGGTGSAGEPTGPFSFYMADLNNGNPTVNGVNVAYIADSEMGIARYDHTGAGWQFSYYIDSTGTIKDADYSVDGTGQVSVSQAATNGGFVGGSTDGTADFAADSFVIDPNKAGGVTGLTGRVVNGQVQLFASTGYGSSLGFNPSPDGSLIEVTDTGAGSSYSKLATATGATEYRGVALSPSETVTSSAQVSAAPTTTSITSTSVTGYHQTSASANDLVSLTASVNTASSTPVNGGTVTFSIYQGTNTNVAPVATATSTAVASGVATALLNVTGLAIGSYTITASYGGTTNLAASPASNTGTLQIVTPLTAAQEANISSIALNSATTQPVSFTPPTASDALGAVNWSFSANGVNFTNSNGTWTGTNFPVGTTTVTGVASDAYGNSISEMFTVTVTPAAKTGAIQATGSKFGKATSYNQTVSISQLAATGTYYYVLSALPAGVTVSSVLGGTITTYNNLPAIKFTYTSGGTTNLSLTFSDPNAVAFNQYQWSIGS